MKKKKLLGKTGSVIGCRQETFEAAAAEEDNEDVHCGQQGSTYPPHAGWRLESVMEPETALFPEERPQEILQPLTPSSCVTDNNIDNIYNNNIIFSRLDGKYCSNGLENRKHN